MSQTKDEDKNKYCFSVCDYPHLCFSESPLHHLALESRRFLAESVCPVLVWELQGVKLLLEKNKADGDTGEVEGFKRL